MKATGIIRRIDELGRIVIPKEMRKTLRIKEGDNLEIYIDNDENIILKKHSQIKKIEDFAQNLTDSVHTNVKHNILITDNDTVIAASGSLKKEYLGKPISGDIEFKIKRREEMLEKHVKKIEIVDNVLEEGTYAITPIVVNGDCQGLVIIFSKDDKMAEEDMRVAQITAEFIKKNLE